MDSVSPIVNVVNIQGATTEALESLFETSDNSSSVRANDNSTMTFFSFSRGKPKPEPVVSPPCIHPIVQTKLMVIHKNPTLFLSLQQRLRERTIRHNMRRQVLEIHVFLNGLKIVEAREEIKTHPLVIADAKSGSFFSSLRSVKKKKLRSIDSTGDESPVGTPDSDAKRSDRGLTPHPSPTKPKSPKQTSDSNAQSRNHSKNISNVVFFPNFDKELNRSRKEYDRFTVEDYVGSSCPERR